MKKLIYLSIIILLMLGLNGCAPALQVVKSGKVDTSDKSIYVAGNSKFHSALRRALKKDGWRITTQYGYINSSGSNSNGNVEINKKMNYSTRYTINCAYRTFWDFGTKYMVDCTTLDNKNGIEIQNLSIDHHEFERYSLEEAVEEVAKSLKSVETKSSKKKIEETNNILDLKDTYIKEDRRFFLKTNKALSGKYQYKVGAKGSYIVADFKDGYPQLKMKYTRLNNLIIEQGFEKGIPIQQKRFYNSGKLKAILTMSKTRNEEGFFYPHGKAVFYRETGDIYFELLMEKGFAKNGTIYNNGEKNKMTDAHFHNFGIPINQK